jgi:hypothetical protein
MRPEHKYLNGSFVELHDIGKSLANVKSNAGNDITGE